MNKEEWIEVFNSAHDKAQIDYHNAERRTPEEYMARLCMSIFDYLSKSIKEKIMKDE